MRCIQFAVVVLIIGAASASNVNTTLLKDQPSCVKQCSTQTLPRYNCTPAKPCFCNDVSLDDEITACLMTNCSLNDQLVAKKFRANTCDLPVRDRRRMLKAVVFCLYGLACIFTILRFFSRGWMTGGAGYGLDDVAAFLTFLPVTWITVSDWYELQNGKGQDIWQVSAGQVVSFLFWFYICQFLYTAVIFGTKLSLVFLYLRIWEGRLFIRPICWTLAAALFGAIVAFEVVAGLQCSPIDYNWNTSNGGTAKCINRGAYMYGVAGANIGFDFVVLLLPIPYLLDLKLFSTHKISICIVFLVGLAITVCGLVRLRYISNFATETNVIWDYNDIGLWSSIEVYLSQVCCCLPATIGLVKRSWYHILSTFTNADDSSISIMGDSGPRVSTDVEKNDGSSSYGSDSAIAPVIQRQSHQLQPKSSYPGNSLREAGRYSEQSPATTSLHSDDSIHYKFNRNSAGRTISSEAFCADVRERRVHPAFREYNLRGPSTAVPVPREHSRNRLETRTRSSTNTRPAARLSIDPNEQFSSWPREQLGNKLAVPRLSTDIIPFTIKDKESESSLGRLVAQQGTESMEYF